MASLRKVATPNFLTAGWLINSVWAMLRFDVPGGALPEEYVVLADRNAQGGRIGNGHRTSPALDQLAQSGT